MNVLYLSYDGLTDPLGQSQIIPYLIGLSRLGHRFTVISFEKKTATTQDRQDVHQQLDSASIKWHPMRYHKWPPVTSTLRDIGQMRRMAQLICEHESFDIVHCRSYITSLVGVKMKQRYGLKFVFDMRGFWADERVEGGLWNLRNPLYRAIYRFFKKKEKLFLERADHVITLTDAALQELSKWTLGRRAPITVIPCCVDMTLFDPNRVDAQLKRNVRGELGIGDNDFVLAYLGSIGTWYLLDETLQFFGHVVRTRPSSKFLFITKEDPQRILHATREHGVNAQDVIIRPANRSEVPRLMSVADAGILFIKPTYSKMASSPTKLGEFMSMGIPVIVNAGVGDGDAIVGERCGIIARGLDSGSLQSSAAMVDRLPAPPVNGIRDAAREHFDLEEGVTAYHRIYESSNVG